MHVEYEIWQDEEMLASTSGPAIAALSEAKHYAMMYSQDGPIKVYKMTREEIDLTKV